MANEWFRLWHEMPNDPKFKTIAKKSGQPLPLVICVFLHVLVNASANASERGRTKGLSIEDIATALDAEEEQITAIMQTMQGRLIDGDLVMRWEKRQPLREDGSAERAKAWRQAQKAAKQPQPNDSETEENNSELKRTQENGKELQDKDKEEDKDIKEKIIKKEKRKTRLPDDFELSESSIAHAMERGVDIATELQAFKDYHTAKGSTMLDWQAAWRTWCGNAVKFGKTNARASPQPVNKQEALEQRNAEVGRRWLAKQGIET